MISYKGVATALFGSLADSLSSTFSSLRISLLKADIKIPLRTYISMAFLSAFLACIFSSIVAFALISYLKVRPPFRLLILIYVPLAAFLATFIAFYLYPGHKASSRRRDIETNLPFVLTHMASIAESGIPPHLIFKLISGFKEYGEVAKELGKVARNIESFGLDPVSAAKEVAKRTPSDSLREVLLGFVSTTEAGGDIRTYLREAGREAIFEWRMRRERFLRQLSAFAEIYIGILIAAPLFIVAVFAVMAMISPTVAGFHVLDLMRISTYAIIPLVNLGFLLFLRGVEVEI